MGPGGVALPTRMEIKSPRALAEWAWQCVFPATRHHREGDSGEPRRHHLHESVVQRASLSPELQERVDLLQRFLGREHLPGTA